MKLLSFLAWIKHWGWKGGLAILDQGFFSGSNFVMNILLARWFSAEQYGAFSLTFAIYLFLSGFHNALILEPMSVFGTAKYSDHLKSYIGGQVFIHFVVTGLLGFLILIIGLTLLLFHLVERFLALFIIGVGISLPLMLLMWLARRSCYVSGKPAWAFISSLVYSFVLIYGAFVLHTQKHPVNPLQWYLLLGMASLAGSVLVYVNPTIVSFQKINWLLWLREQWTFGKWIVLATILYFVGTQIQLVAVAARLGLDEAGAFRAIQNFILPMMQVLTAVSVLLLPSFAFEFGHQNFRGMHRGAVKIIVALTAAALAYLIVLLMFGRTIEQLLYNGKFTEFGGLIPLFGVVPLMTAMEIGFSLVVRSLQRPVYYAVSTGSMAIIGILFGVIFVAFWGVQGAVWSLILVAAASLGINVWFYHKWFVQKLIAELATE